MAAVGRDEGVFALVKIAHREHFVGVRDRDLLPGFIVEGGLHRRRRGRFAIKPTVIERDDVALRKARSESWFYGCFSGCRIRKDGNPRGSYGGRL